VFVRSDHILNGRCGACVLLEAGGGISPKFPIPIPPNYWNGLVTIIVGETCFWGSLGQIKGESILEGIVLKSEYVFNLKYKGPFYLMKRIIQE
jgi:hypothetical protein